MERNAKRAPPTFDQKCYIDELPDEMLGNIISCLPVKEAAKTSVLCHRWRNLWTYSTSLDFDAKDTMQHLYNNGCGKTRHQEAHKYIESVNQVLLNTHKGSTLDGLRICYDMWGYRYSITTTLDKWVDFAIFKRVRILELDLSSIYGSRSYLHSSYRFPSWLLNMIPLDPPSFDRLTTLRLKSVSIVDTDVAYLLSTCLMLEALSVENAGSLQNLRVISGQALKLNHLVIRCCWKLENVEIDSATNLTCFKYAGQTINLCFTNVPKLTSISLGSSLWQNFIFESHTNLSRRLKKLELDLICANWKHDGCCMNGVQGLLMFPEFRNLEQLELNFIAATEEEDKTLLYLISIIAAYPSLHKLTLKYKMVKGGAPPEYQEELGGAWRRYTHFPFLKVIKFVGWVGVQTDVQLANYLIQSASNLDKVILDLRIPHFRETSWSGEFYPREIEVDEVDDRPESAALLSAMQVEKKLSPTSKLVIV